MGGQTEPSLGVSIQLVSPASGDFTNSNSHVALWLVSIQLVSPASGDSLTRPNSSFSVAASFHSIGFPSEWGPPTPCLTSTQRLFLVSIQLVSPASGDVILTESQ